MSPSGAGEKQAGSPDGPRSTRSTQSGTLTLGLLPAPDMPERIASELADELPNLLSSQIDDSISWEVSVITDPLTGDWRGAPEILDEVYEHKQREGWDYAICLTDLPVFRGGRFVVADASERRGIGGISLPILGVTLLRRRVREAMLQLVSELHEGTSESDRDREQRGREQQNDGTDDGTSDEQESLRGGGARQLIGNRITERLAPIKRITPSDEEMDVDVRYISPGRGGYLRLLAGMVLANRPWSLFTIMKSALAAAFATGADVLVTPSIWQLGYSGGLARMFALMVVALAAMVVWFILSHDLWERSSERGSRREASLYNGATALTLCVAVLFSYIVLYVLILLAALIFIEPGFFQTNIQSIVGRPLSPLDYAILAWMTSSLALVAGALGSGLEDEETVLRATYGYRQRRRAEEYQKRRRAEESEEGSQPDGGSVTRG